MCWSETTVKNITSTLFEGRGWYMYTMHMQITNIVYIGYSLYTWGNWCVNTANAVLVVCNILRGVWGGPIRAHVAARLMRVTRENPEETCTAPPHRPKWRTLYTSALEGISWALLAAALARPPIEASANLASLPHGGESTTE